MSRQEISQLICEIKIYLELYGYGQHLFRKKQVDRFTYMGSMPPEKVLGASELSENNQVMEQILKYCDEETLDEIECALGEDSQISQLIRQKRITKYQHKSNCDLKQIGNPLENAIRNIKNNGNPFYESVCKYIDRLGYKKDSEFYNAIGMPRQQFARLRDAANSLSKKTVLWIITGLKLNYKEASDLLQKAGYHFKKTDKRDVILTYIFRNTDYDLLLVNEVLVHFNIDPFC